MEQQYNQVMNLERIQVQISRFSGDLHVLDSCHSDQDELASVYELLQDIQVSIGKNIADLELLLMQLPQYQAHLVEQAQDQCEVDSLEVHKLSCKEHEVLNMFAKGYSYNEAATLLGCKLATIQTYAKRIYKKLRVHSRSEAIYEARQLDLINV